MDRGAWDERYAGAELVWSAEPNRFFAEEVGHLPPARALDVACGEGRNAVWLAERGWTVTGVDFSGVALGKGRQLAERRGVEVTWVEADVVTDGLPAGPFELVALCYLHLPAADRAAVTRRAARAVAPGGSLVVVAHARANLDGGFGGPQDPALLAEPDEVVADLDGNGLEVERSVHLSRRVETADGPRTALDLLVRARRP